MKWRDVVATAAAAVIFLWNCATTQSRFLAGSKTVASLLPNLMASGRKELNEQHEDVVTEVFHLLQKMFIDKHKFEPGHWKAFELEVRNCNVALPDALSRLVHRLGDPYFRVLSKDSLESQQRRTYGVRVGVGLEIERRLSLMNLRQELRAAIVPFRGVKLATRLLGACAATLLLMTREQRAIRWMAASCGGAAATVALANAAFPVVVTAVSEESSEVQVGDVIRRVNGRPLPPLPVSWLRRRLDKGAAGDVVQLEVLRAAAVRSVRTSRQLLDTSVVHPRVLSPRQGEGLGYLRISEFSTSCLEDAQKALQSLSKELRSLQNTALQALVIDLRDNQGGAMVAALQLASLFTPYNAPLLHIRAGKERQTLRNVHGLQDICEERTLAQRLNPMIWGQHVLEAIGIAKSSHVNSLANVSVLLLVNHNTASASEIFVEAVRGHHRSVQTMGCQTVGKNKAQALVTLSDGSGVCFSILEFLTPSGRSMGLGHRPNIRVEDGRVDLERLRFRASPPSWEYVA